MAMHKSYAKIVSIFLRRRFSPSFPPTATRLTADYIQSDGVFVLNVLRIMLAHVKRI